MRCFPPHASTYLIISYYLFHKTTKPQNHKNSQQPLKSTPTNINSHKTNTNTNATPPTNIQPTQPQNKKNWSLSLKPTETKQHITTPTPTQLTSFNFASAAGAAFSMSSSTVKAETFAHWKLSSSTATESKTCGERWRRCGETMWKPPCWRGFSHKESVVKAC